MNIRVVKAVGDINGNVRNAPTKKYGRAMNKAQSLDDHKSKHQPRTGYNIDLVRNLVECREIDDMIRVLEVLNEEFDGIAKLKNLFSLDETKRAERYHLCTLMVTVIIDGRKTYGKMLESEEFQNVWEEYTAAIPLSESKERWERITALAWKYLNHPELRKCRVRAFGEVQIILHADSQIRHAMHMVYKVSRATNEKQLHLDFNESYGVRRDQNNITSVYNAAFYGRLNKMTDFLEKQKKDPDAGYAGYTPLYIAANKGFVDCAYCLIKNKANVNLPIKSNGATPLYIASNNGQIRVLVLVIDIVRSFRTNDNCNAMHIVTGHSDCAKILVEHNVSITSNFFDLKFPCNLNN